MKRIIAGIVLVTAAVPAAGNQSPQMKFECSLPAAATGAVVPNLHGTWDFLMEVGGNPNFGLLSIGFVGADYGGTLALWSTAPVIARKLTLIGNKIHMAVASPDGDVLLDGTLSPKGDRICGTVTYHGGRTFPAVARKRPMTYQSQPQAQRAR